MQHRTLTKQAELRVLTSECIARGWALGSVSRVRNGVTLYHAYGVQGAEIGYDPLAQRYVVVRKMRPAQQKTPVVRVATVATPTFGHIPLRNHKQERETAVQHNLRNRIAAQWYAEWKELRREWNQRGCPVTCECSHCHKLRRAAARLKLPLAGAPDHVELA